MSTSAVGEHDTVADPGSGLGSDGPRIDALRGLEGEVAVMIRRVRRVIVERAQAVHSDLQPASYLLLSWLADEGPVRASAIVESFHIDKGAVSRQLTHLVELGLVDRTPDPGDGRAMLVSASAEASRRLRSVVEDRRLWLDQRLGDWSSAELDEFVALLGRYNRALDLTP